MNHRTAAAASWSWFATAGELLLVVWSIPLAILLFGLPIVLAIRVAIEITERLLGR
jgi:hypothetical protein